MSTNEQRSILIADADADTAASLRDRLASHDIQTVAVRDGAAALAYLRCNAVHLVLAEMALSDMDCFTLLSHVRSQSVVPVVLLSADAQRSQRMRALDMGADAFLTKPFDPPEAAAYIRALLRRFLTFSAPSAGLMLTCGDLVLDTASLCLTKGGAPVPVTMAEYKILLRLMRAPGEVLTKRQLYACINLSAARDDRDTIESDENTVMVHISKLREKIEANPRAPRFIKTVRTRGYCFTALPPQQE